MSDSTATGGCKGIVIGLAAVAAVQATTVAVLYQFWNDVQMSSTTADGKSDAAQASRDAMVERLSTMSDGLAPKWERRIIARRIARHELAKVAAEKEGLPDAARFEIDVVDDMIADGWRVAHVAPMPPEPVAEAPTGRVDVLFVMERVVDAAGSGAPPAATPAAPEAPAEE